MVFFSIKYNLIFFFIKCLFYPFLKKVFFHDSGRRYHYQQYQHLIPCVFNPVLHLRRDEYRGSRSHFALFVADGFYAFAAQYIEQFLYRVGMPL